MVDQRRGRGVGRVPCVGEARVQSREALERALVQARLEPSPLGVARLEQAPARSLELRDLRPHLGLQARVRAREPCRRRHPFEQRRVVEDGSVVHEHRHLGAVALDAREVAPATGVRQVDRQSGGIDVAAVDAVGDVERRVAERVRQRVAHIARARLAEVDDEVDDAGALPRLTQQAVDEERGERDEPGLVEVQQRVALARSGPDQVRARDGREDRGEDGSCAQRVRPLAAPEPDRTQVVRSHGDQQNGRERVCGRVAPPRRACYRDHVGEGDYTAVDPSRSARARVREDKLGERGAVEQQCCRREVAGEPCKAARGQQQPGAPAGDEAAGEQRPAGEQIGDPRAGSTPAV